jgi:hypothetical protein
MDRGADRVNRGEEARESPEAAEESLAELMRLRAEVRSLRCQCEEKDFAILEMRSAHLQERNALQAIAASKDRAVAALEQDLLQHQQHDQSGLRDALQSDADNQRLRDECLHLRLLLDQAYDRAASREHERSLDPAALGGDENDATQRRLGALESSRLSLEAEAAQLRLALDRRAAEAVAAAEEAAAVRSRLEEQRAKVRALHDQLTGFIRREAEDAARAERAEAERDAAQTELQRRLGQLQRVVAALTELRTAEAQGREALAEERRAAGDLRAALAEERAESARSKRALAILERQHTALADEVERLREHADGLEAQSEANAALVEASTRSAEQIEALAGALEACRAENDGLAQALGDARAEARRESLALQRLADDRQAAIVALQADLSAATAAVASMSRSSGAGAVAAGVPSAAAGSEADDAGAALGARSLARRRGMAVGSTGGRPILASAPASTGAADATGAEGGAASDAVALRLQLESLGRRSQQQSERCRSLEAEVDALTRANDDLQRELQREYAAARAARTGAAALVGGRGAASSAAEGSAPRSPTAQGAGRADRTMQQLCSDALRCEGVFRAAAALLAAVVALLQALEQRGADSGQWQSSARELQSLSADGHSGAYMRAVDAFVRFGLDSDAAATVPALVGRQWTDLGALQSALERAATLAGDSLQALADHEAAALGQACVTQ